MLKKLKKFFVLLLIVPCLFLFGCKGKSDESGTGDGGNPAVTEPVSPGTPTEPENPSVDPTDKTFSVSANFGLPQKYEKLLPTVSSTVKVGNSYSMPVVADAKLAEYFDGWYYNNGTETKVEGQTFTSVVEQNVSFYAKWKSGFEEYLQSEYYTDGLVFEESGAIVSVKSYSGTSSVVVIPKIYNGKNITLIGSSSFSGNSHILDVIVSSNVISVGERAFSLSSLKTFDLTVVREIGSYAFAGTNLENVSCSALLENIGSFAFNNCAKLTSVNLSSSVLQTIPERTFSGCVGLTEITLPNSIAAINSYAFSGCGKISSLTFLNNCNSLTTIADRAFENCTGIESISIYDSVLSLGGEVFNGCTGLKSITLSRLFVGNSSSTFSDYFGNIPNLKTINLTGNYITEITNRYFADLSSLENFVMNGSLEIISNSAFYGCTNLASIEFSNSLDVEKFNPLAFVQTAWFECGTEPLVIGTTLCFVPSGVGENVDLTSYNITTIGKNAFISNSSVKNVKIPANTTKISSEAFYNCTNLVSVEFATGSLLQTIGDSAFEYCESLENIDLANCTSLISIGENAFYSCESLSSFNIPNSIREIGEGAFSGTNISSFEMTENNYFKTIYGVLYSKNSDGTLWLIAYPVSKTDEILVLPENVSKICSGAFYGNEFLEYLYIQFGLDVEIAMMAFDTGVKILSESPTFTSNYETYYLLDNEYYDVTRNDEGEFEITINEDAELDSEYYFAIFTFGVDDYVISFRVDTLSKEVYSWSIDDITEKLLTAMEEQVS